MRYLIVIFALFLALPVSAAPADTEDFVKYSFRLLSQRDFHQSGALRWFRDRGSTDAAAVIIDAMRFQPPEAQQRFDRTLRTLTGERHKGWFDWMLWQERHPEVAPHPAYPQIKAQILGSIDPGFKDFFRTGTNYTLRMEEVAWGGVRKDGIPALTNPKFLQSGERVYAKEDELVFGIAFNDDARAYPLRIMDWHEMLNDVVGGIPVSLAYCTLCGSGILFHTDHPEAPDGKPFQFGSSGLLYRSNKLMFDRRTESLWNHFTGTPVVGPLVGKGIKLAVLPLTLTSWGDWKRAHPDTKLLSLNTGHDRDYRPGRPYGKYFASDDLMFPNAAGDTQQKGLDAKDWVFALRMTGADKAWPLIHFKGGKAINDHVGTVSLVLIGDADTRTVRAYRRTDQTFQLRTDALLDQNGKAWQVTEAALQGPNGETLTRLPGHIAFWFAYSGFIGSESLSLGPNSP